MADYHGNWLAIPYDQEIVHRLSLLGLGSTSFFSTGASFTLPLFLKNYSSQQPIFNSYEPGKNQRFLRFWLKALTSKIKNFDIEIRKFKNFRDKTQIFEKVDVDTSKESQKYTDYDGTEQNSKIRLQHFQKIVKNLVRAWG